MRQKSIYIILTRTTTVISRLISYITGKKYSHASISTDGDLTDMYSFGRKKRNNPFIGGFCRESLDKGVFADCKSLPYAVVQVKTTAEQYDRINSLIRKYEQDAENYRYNYAGLLFAWMGKACKHRNRFYCSEFVYELLSQGGIVCGEMPVVIHPQDLIKYGEIIEEGDWKQKQVEIKIKEPSLHFVLSGGTINGFCSDIGCRG